MARKSNRTNKSSTTHRSHETQAQRQSVDEERRHEEYGGFKIGAAFFGWLSATALAAILTSLISAGGVSLALGELQQNVGAIEGIKTIGFVGGILFILSLAIAYYAGGYVAGRMARYDGARQGVGVWLVGIVITLLLALAGFIFGSSYNVVQQMNLPRIPVDEGTLTTGGLIALLVALAVTLGSAIAGGKVGERYHRKVNRASLGR